MTSAQWRKRREAYFEKHDKICSACKTNQNIHLHHVNYERFGRERDIDLLPLCYVCHKNVHLLQRRERLSVAEATKAYIIARKRKKKKTLSKRRPRGKKKYAKVRQTQKSKASMRKVRGTPVVR